MFAWKKITTGMIIAFFLGINVILMCYVAFFKKDALWLETLKVWWRENMQLVTKLYQSEGYQQQQKSAIEQVLGNVWAETVPSDTTTSLDGDRIDAATLASLKKDAFVEWSKDARITILEYSELLCPYCQRQSDSKVMEQLVDKYNGKVNVIFKHYIVHPEAKVLAEAAQCVWEQLGSEKFYQFIAQWFNLEDKSESGVLAFAKRLGAKEKTFTECLSSGRYSASVDASTTEGRTLFGVTWTPWNVVIDNEKWTFVLIAWVYPMSEFVSTIDAMLK